MDAVYNRIVFILFSNINIKIEKINKIKSDLLTLAVTGKNIGAHLDDAVGQPLLDFSDGGN